MCPRQATAASSSCCPGWIRRSRAPPTPPPTSPCGRRWARGPQRDPQRSAPWGPSQHACTHVPGHHCSCAPHAPSAACLAPRTAQAQPTEEEIRFILDAIADYLTVKVRRSDVQSAWSGIRPLALDPNAAGAPLASSTHACILSCAHSALRQLARKAGRACLATTASVCMRLPAPSLCPPTQTRPARLATTS